MLFAGWRVHTYYTGYQQSLEDKVQQVISSGISDYQRNQAQGLEDTQKLLSNLKANTIIKEPTIINRPIYSQPCMDQDGADLLKQNKEDSIKVLKAAIAQGSTNSGKGDK